MGVGRIIYSGGHQGIFLKFFWGDQSGEVWFFPLKTKKTIFCILNISKSSGGFEPPAPSFRRPWMYVKISVWSNFQELPRKALSEGKALSRLS